MGLTGLARDGYAEKAVEAADYGNEGWVMCAVGSLTHVEFQGHHFIFDLRKCYMPDQVREMITKVVLATTNFISNQRISFLELEPVPMR